MTTNPTYEFAEAIVGLIFQQEGPAIMFLQIRSLTGDETTRDFNGSRLEALNMMGAQGWQYVSEMPAAEGRVQWIAGALGGPRERIRIKSFEATEFLMTREVRE